MKTKTASLALVFGVFFLSGLAALIYEISWARQIGLLFGHTVQAASTVLASYFAGMGCGYWIGAHLSGRVRPLLGYAIAELVIGIWAIAIPWLIAVSESSAYAPLLSDPNWAWQTFVRAAFSFGLLLPATVSMGVTLPLMAEFLAEVSVGQRSNKTAGHITIAYALNTLGALAGTVLTTFFLLINFGVRGSSYLGVAVSLLCALLALRISSSSAKDPKRILVVGQQSVPSAASPTLVLMLACASGFGTLALQVLFTRMFALVFHNSTYTFGVVVAVFLAALAGGAAAASFLQRYVRVERLAGISTGVGAILTLVAVIVFVQYTQLSYFSSGASFAGYIFGAFGLVGGSIGPAIFCLGMLLPLVWAMAGVDGSAGTVVGKLTSLNTLGAAAGAIVASYFLLVYVGLWQSIVLIGGLFLLCAIVLLLTINHRKLSAAFAIVFAIGAVIGLSSPNDAEYGRAKLGEEILKRFQSPYGWIDVVKLKESSAHKIRQNLHYRFGRTGSNVREFRQAHIPLFLHPKPREILFLGLGTGLTAGGAIAHQDLESIEAVELIPEVVDAVRMLSEFNNNIVDDPKSKIYVDDARHFLLASEKRYDVIISDLFVPWESQSGYLYTVEHYEVAIERLKEDGLFCQWLPLYQVGGVEFESIANGFAKVFPHTTLWWGQQSNRKPVIALVGSRAPILLDAAELSKRIESVNENRRTVDPNVASVERLFELYAGDWMVTSQEGLNTDEFPRVEFLTPISNRNRELLSGGNFEDFYDKRMVDLATDDVSVVGLENPQSTERIRAKQQLILFGGEE